LPDGILSKGKVSADPAEGSQVHKFTRKQRPRSHHGKARGEEEGTRFPVFNQPRPVERGGKTGVGRAGKWFKKIVISCLMVMESFIF